LRYHAEGLGGRPRLLGRAWSAECNDRPRMNLGRRQAGAAQQQRQPVSPDLSLTCDVPAVDLSCTSRAGTDDGERSKGPVNFAAPGDAGFATAPDLVRFAHALGDGTVLDRPYADLLTGAKFPLAGGQQGQPALAYPSFAAYDIPVKIIKGQWAFGRAGADPGIG